MDTKKIFFLLSALVAFMFLYHRMMGDYEIVTHKETMYRINKRTGVVEAHHNKASYDHGSCWTIQR